MGDMALSSERPLLAYSGHTDGVVTDPDVRARVFGEIVPGLDWAGSLKTWIEGSPLVEIELG
jgi:hypothetical protein